MKKVLVLVLLVLFSLGMTQCLAEGVEQKTQQPDLQSACLSATITAINLEINRYQNWIDSRKQQGNSRDLLELQASLNFLKADLEKYRNMDCRDYVLPEKVRTKAWVQGKAGDNTVLGVEGMTKMGPFYHLAGIVGDNYPSLVPNVSYEMTFYKVYPRSYWYMESEYIYIAELSK